MGTIDGLDLGTFGVWSFDFEFQPAAKMRASIQELEAQGWRALWIPRAVRAGGAHARRLSAVVHRAVARHQRHCADLVA